MPCFIGIRFKVGLERRSDLPFFRKPSIELLVYIELLVAEDAFVLCKAGRPLVQLPRLGPPLHRDPFDRLLLAQESIRRPERHHLTPANVAVEGRQRQTLGQGGGHD